MLTTDSDTAGAVSDPAVLTAAPVRGSGADAVPHTEEGAVGQQRRRGRNGFLARYLRRFSATGLVVALAFYCFSLTPSLIPRSWLYQGVITGICLVAGYGFGVLLEWLIVKLGFRIRWNPRVSRIAWWVLAGATIVLVPLFIVLGVGWQNQIRVLFGMETTGNGHGLGVLAIALIVALLLLQISRGLRRIVQWLIGLIVRVVPVPVARLISVVAVSALVLFLVNGVLWTGALHLLNNVYSAANATIDPTLQRPTEAERSGSPVSNETWESLGAAGREFVAGGPSMDQLRAFAAAGSAVDPAGGPGPDSGVRGTEPRR